jgi:hypothetical protein
MGGNAGDDTYMVDDLADGVFENAGEGSADKVIVALSGYTLAAEVEIGAVGSTGGLSLTGNSGDNVLFGNDGNDQLFGGDGADQFAGSAGDDVIDGGAGADAMGGNDGNDLYFVDDLGDGVVENAGEGFDAVLVTVSGYTLAANVENGAIDSAAGLTLVGNGANNVLWGGDGDDGLLGGAGNDDLIGGAGNDVINGGAGGDGLFGSTGNDTYVVDSISDFVGENVGEGVDRVISSVSFTLPANVENLVMTGAGTTATGNAAGNVITAAATSLTLIGNAGNDTFLIADESFASIAGGAHLDRISLQDDGQAFSLTNTAARISGVEIVSMAGADGASLTLAAADILAVNGAGALYVTGGPDDAVDVTDPGIDWTIITSTHTNPAVSGETFVHYQHTSGANLFVTDEIVPVF